MDYKEFKTEFNLVYNNLASNQAPGLDEVEISIYLTKAQMLLTDALYAEFEQSEEARRKLAKLVKTVKPSKVTIPTSDIVRPEYTTTYSTLSDVRYIINEQVMMSSSADRCIKGKFIKVQPVSHDELNTIIENPYRFNIRRALRLDTGFNDTNYIEILTKDKNIDYYQIRYIKNPKPIFVYSSSDYDDTIEGFTPPATLTVGTDLGSLPKETHRQIIEMAARLAYQDYKQ